MLQTAKDWRKFTEVLEGGLDNQRHDGSKEEGHVEVVQFQYTHSSSKIILECSLLGLE
jgi:hypothetical protein